MPADYPMTVRARVRVAVWSASMRGVLAARAALWWHGIIATPPEVPLVSVPRGWHSAPVPNATVVCRDLDDVDIVERSGLRVTAVPLSVLESAVDGGMNYLDTALQLRRVSVEQLTAAYERRRGRIGAAKMRPMLAALESGAHSAAERRTVALFREAGLTGWVANYPDAGYEIDFAFVAQRVAVEIDGMAFHRDAATFQRDRARRNALIAAGWVVINFTWADLTERPGYVAATIRRALHGAQV